MSPGLLHRLNDKALRDRRSRSNSLAKGRKP
jgi:hypothetical protein